MSTLDMGIYRLCPRQWTGLTSLTPLTPPYPSSKPQSVTFSHTDVRPALIEKFIHHLLLLKSYHIYHLLIKHSLGTKLYLS